MLLERRKEGTMGRLNVSRVVLGGLLAGILINISEYLRYDVVMRGEFEAGMRALGKGLPQGGVVTVIWTLWGFALGIAAVWLYAAIRPRYGAGAGTAVRAGVAVWFFTSLLAIIAMRAMGLFEVSGLALVWTLAECVAATLAGAWLYRETEA
jgi:hypothetical protein